MFYVAHVHDQFAVVDTNTDDKEDRQLPAVCGNFKTEKEAQKWISSTGVGGPWPTVERYNWRSMIAERRYAIKVAKYVVHVSAPSTTDLDYVESQLRLASKMLADSGPASVESLPLVESYDHTTGMVLIWPNLYEIPGGWYAIR